MVTELEQETAAPAESQEAAPADPVAEAPPAVDEEALSGYLTELGLPTTEAEPALPADAGDDWIAQVPEAIRPRVESELAEAKRVRDATRAQQEIGRRNAFAGRIGAIESYLNEQGLDPAAVARVTATFNAHHQDSLKFAQDEVSGQYVDTTYKALADVLPAAERDVFMAKRSSHGDTPSMVKDFLDSARKGYLSEAQAKAQAREAASKVILDLQTHPEKLEALRSKTKAPNLGNGTGSNGANPRNLDEARAMHAGTHPSGKTLTNVQFREYRDTHKE